MSSNRCTWILGSLAALLLALGVALHQGSKNPDLMRELTDNFSAVNDTIFGGFGVTVDDLTSQYQRIRGMVQTPDMQRPGQLAYEQGMRAKHPLVIVPGFVTSGLEVWQGQPCAATLFRQRLWGTITMAQALLTNKTCWIEHMMLDEESGSDPPNIKLRACKGLEAIDYFVKSYWVFAKLVASMADIGYDTNTMVAMPYDWRLPLPIMESRDGYFSRLKNEIEQQHLLSRQKVVLLSHSYGCTVVLTFLAWVEKTDSGWADTHLHAYINAAGPVLGLPKALAPVLAGDARETADLMTGVAFVVERYLSRVMRAQLMRTWGSVMAMFPTGGTKVWGNATWAPDDDEQIKKAGRSYGGMIASIQTSSGQLEEAANTNNTSNISSQDVGFLQGTLGEWMSKLPLSGHKDSDDESRGDEEVTFLDVDAVLKELAIAAGPTFTRNVLKWSPAAQRLDKDALLAAAETQAKREATLRQKLKQEEEDKDGSGKGRGECDNDGNCSGDSDTDNTTTSSSTSNGADNDDDDKDGKKRGLLGNMKKAAGRAVGAARRHGDTESGGGAEHEVQPIDPTRVPLPNAPHMSIYCLYGTGVPTERGYHLIKKQREDGRPIWSINGIASEPESGLESGVQLTDGDGTMPIMSLGVLCEGGWRTKRLNPAGSNVVVREYKNAPVPMWQDPRGGPGAATHVEILGNEAMLFDVLRIVAGRADDPTVVGSQGQGEGSGDDEQGQVVDNRYFSAVREMAAKITWAEL